MKEMYENLGISEKVYSFGSEIEKTLQQRFKALDEVAEYNQLNVMQKKIVFIFTI